MNDTTTGTTAEPDDYGTPPMIAAADVPPDTKPKRPTTRAGRRAAAAANKAAGKDTAPKATKTAPRKASLESRLTNSIVSLGGVVAASSALTGSQPLQADGLVLIEHSADIAAAINRVADQDPRVKAALEKMLSAGAWSGVVAAMLPVVLAIAGNHGLIPPQFSAMLGMATGQPPAAAPAAA